MSEVTKRSRKTNAEKQRDFRDRQLKRGLVLVREWVPGSKADELRNVARKLRGS